MHSCLRLHRQHCSFVEGLPGSILLLSSYLPSSPTRQSDYEVGGAEWPATGYGKVEISSLAEKYFARLEAAYLPANRHTKYHAVEKSDSLRAPSLFPIGKVDLPRRVVIGLPVHLLLAVGTAE